MPSAKLTKRRSSKDFWTKRFTSQVPWERQDVSTYDGTKFAKVISEKVAHPETFNIPKR
jgi:hypothetical protein